MTTLTVKAIISEEVGGQAFSLPPRSQCEKYSERFLRRRAEKRAWLDEAFRNTVTELFQSVVVATDESTKVPIKKESYAPPVDVETTPTRT